MPFIKGQSGNPSTQFKPGESGNPSGVPKGTKQISTWINQLLNDEKFVTTIRDGLEIKEYKGAPIQAIVQAHIRLALNGDVRAADMLFKHGGVQKVQLGNDPDNPLTLGKQLSEEELRDRLSEIVSARQSGSDSNNLGTGQTAGG